MRAASETDSYKFRVILSRKVMDGFKSCKQYKGRLLLVTKTVGPTRALLLYLFTQPAPQGDDQAVFAHTVMAPAPSWEEGV